MSIRKYLSIWLTSHFKNRVGKTALTNKKLKKNLKWFTLLEAIAGIFVEKGQFHKMNKIHKINCLLAICLLTVVNNVQIMYFSSRMRKYSFLSKNADLNLQEKKDSFFSFIHNGDAYVLNINYGSKAIYFKKLWSF